MSITWLNCTRERVESKTDVQVRDPGRMFAYGGELDPLADGMQMRERVSHSWRRLPSRCKPARMTESWVPSW
jgi:hypothetical protein